MEAPISLTDYIEKRKQRDEKPVPFRPVWVRRALAKQLPNKDFSGKGPEAA